MHMKCCASFIFSNDSKHDSTTTFSHSNHIIELLKQRIIMSNTLSKIWVNTYGCAYHYRCSTAFYLMSMLPQAFSVIIDRGISAPVHVRELLNGLNGIGKRVILQLMSTVQLPGAKFYEKQMVMHTGTRTSNVSLAS